MAKRHINHANISTHTLTWSVTVFGKKAYKPRKYFNSHAHVERDDGYRLAVSTDTDFNSHAHVERDELTLALEYSDSNFNSHAHVERDIGTFIGSYSGFISTHTLTWSVTNVALKNSATNAISTHTLTWSVTSNATIYKSSHKFQLTRSRGA